MSHHSPNKQNLSPKQQANRERAEHHDSHLDYVFRRILHWIERVIAAVTVIALVTALAVEIRFMFITPGYFENISHLLHNLLTIVVGLEFVRMLLDTTPTNILEVLMVAITRHVILSHDDPWSNVACIACIAGLFAIRRFLVLRSELKKEMLDQE